VPPVIREVDVEELAENLESGVRLFDVREVQEYVAGHVPGAILVPLSELVERAAEFSGPGPVFVICRSGGRSIQACEYLATMSIETVNVAGGTMAWIDSGRDVVDGDLPT
jgi:rhodanese-related sulfurtransferase